MPGQDQYVKLPDGSYVHVPGDATPDQLSQLKQKLAATDPLRSGESMIENAQRQNVSAAKSKLQNATPSYAAMAVENSPGGADPHNPGNPNLNAVPESERAGVNSRALNIALATTPLMGAVGDAAGAGKAGMFKLGRSIIGAGVGAGIGERGGAAVGGLAGETGRKVGGAVGAVGGGILGGGLAGGLERNPSTMRVQSLPFGMQRAIPEWMVPGPSEDEIARGAFMNRGYKPSSEIMKAAAAKAPLPEVMHAPITSEGSWLQKPEGNIQNVPRSELPGMISRTGDPAAVKEARRLGSAVLYVPEEYPGPRKAVDVPDDEAPE